MNSRSVWRQSALLALSLTLVLLVMVVLVNSTELANQTWLRVFFGISALNFTLRASIPIVLGALSGILCERSGIINIGIEGMMLAGAFAGFVAKVATNDWPLLPSLFIGVAAALLVGGLMGLLHAALSIRFRMNQIISGTVLIILATGFTSSLFNREAVAAGKFSPIRLPLLADIPVLGNIFFNNPPLTYLTLLLVVVVHV
nr:hypothetical protein [Caldilineaceae bacterium]